MESKKISFKGSQGEQLAARIDKPGKGLEKGAALFAHCFTCSKNLRAVGHISQSLTEHGVGIMRFDFTGLGESEGDFADTNFSSNVDDLVAAAGYMKSEGMAPRMLIGHSLGGAAVLQAAARIASIEAVVTIGAPCNPKHVQHLLLDKKEDIEKNGEANVQLAGRQFTIKKQFLDDLAAQKMDEVIQNLGKALLIFHSPVDNTVGIDNAAHIYKLAKHPKSFISLDDSDHLLSNEQDAKYVGSVTAVWVDRYF
ncbi:lysophospholipase [Aliifodinibius sp. S!AR15-10]|uniref:alpha/beta hydrolase family protein n=1 Tax=Aliifodinibius sp. S!AR15-10 TaxID=2950437 RepID=UPI00285D96E8|nr:alpha/beta fold hydrolase [Aliifodinibius sp. S!AR15-10]MDR8389718.1 lysophospholipase [Aliifodinibius sp. S!AR15-10]